MRKRRIRLTNMHRDLIAFANERGYFPDHRAERRQEFATTTAADRVAEAIELSRTLTQLASLAR